VGRRWPATSLYRRTDALLAVSADVEARCRGAGLAAPALARVDGVVDVGRFADGAGVEPFKKELGLDARWVVGSVARLAPRRGHELLIRGFSLFLAERPDARLVLIGKGERRDALEGLVAGMGLAEHVIFAGYRDGDLPAALRSLDAFALLGAGSDESCRAALEAMAAARPVLARDVGALADAVVPGETGLLLDDERPESVADALRRLARDPDRARAMGAAGQRRAVERYSVARHAERLEAIYRDVLARRARSG
jgi:glycosyltransferase involved in cell wall biosynthesis